MECLLVTKRGVYVYVYVYMYNKLYTRIQCHLSNKNVCLWVSQSIVLFSGLNIYYNEHLILYYNEFQWKSNQSTYDSCICTDDYRLAQMLPMRRLCCEL